MTLGENIFVAITSGELALLIATSDLKFKWEGFIILIQYFLGKDGKAGTCYGTQGKWKVRWRMNSEWMREIRRGNWPPLFLTFILRLRKNLLF